MGEHKLKLGTQVRKLMRLMDLKRRSIRQRIVNFTRMPAKTRMSTRGEVGDTWNTKKNTKARRKSKIETLLMRKRMERDKVEKAKSKADHVERHP